MTETYKLLGTASASSMYGTHVTASNGTDQALSILPLFYYTPKDADKTHVYT
jgi:hypothetical protein